MEILTIIIFLLIIGAVIFIHEFGHFLAAKLTNVKVEEFCIGFPPIIFKKQKGETLYSIGLVPFGGYNKIYGMDDIDEKKEDLIHDKRSYCSQKFLVKLFIILAGVLMNFLLASLIFYFVLFPTNFEFFQPLIFSDYQFPIGNQKNIPIVAEISEDSPAKDILAVQDTILKVNNEPILNSSQFQNLIEQNKGRPIFLEVKNLQNKESKIIEVTPRDNYPTNEGPLGIAFSDCAYLTYGGNIFSKIISGFSHTYNLAHFTFVTLGNLIGYSIKEKSGEILASSFVGPVGIFAVTKLTVEQGFLALLNLLAIISLGLGAANLLPIPALDGGKTLFLFIESLTKKFTPKLQLQIENYGMIFIILLAIFLVVKDFIQFKEIIF